MRTATAALALSLLTAAAALAASDDELQTAQNGLELFYIGNEEISPVVCQAEQTDFGGFVLCRHPLQERGTGDLWAVLEGPILVPMNGKAIATAKEHGTSITATDTTPIVVKTVQEAFPKVPVLTPILDAFK